MSDIDKESLWKQYHLHIDLYKHYLELVIKFNLFYYAVTGAILSFYFTNSQLPLIKYSLLFPILLSLGFGGFFFYGANLMSVIRKDIFYIRDAIGLYSAPDVNVLAVLLRISAIFFFCVAFCMLVLFFVQLTPIKCNVT